MSQAPPRPGRPTQGLFGTKAPAAGPLCIPFSTQRRLLRLPLSSLGAGISASSSVRAGSVSISLPRPLFLVERPRLFVSRDVEMAGAASTVPPSEIDGEVAHEGACVTHRMPPGSGRMAAVLKACDPFVRSVCACARARTCASASGHCGMSRSVRMNQAEGCRQS